MTPVGSKQMSIRRMQLPPRTEPLIRQLYMLVVNHPTHSLSSVAVAAGLNNGTVAEWRRRQMPSLKSFDSVLRVLGYRLAIVPIDTPEKKL